MRQFGPLVGSNWFISVLVLVLLCLVTYSSAGNCSDVQAVVLEREGTRWVVSASDVTVYPLAYGQLIPETYFRWSLTTLVERNRTTRDSDGFSIQPRCVDPSCPPEQFFCILDPIEPHVDDTPCTGRVANPCGALAHAMFTKDMNCYLQHYTAPFHGFERETVSITFSHPDYPDMKVVAENHLLNGDFEYYPIPGQPILVNRYSKNSLKISYRVTNWPWKGDPEFTPGASNMASWVSLWWNITTSFTKGTLFNDNDDPTRRIFGWISEDNSTRMILDISAIYEADGHVLTIPQLSSWPGFMFEPLTLTWSTSVDMCNQTLGHWSQMDYDPSLTALFTPEPEPPSPSKAPNSKSSRLTASQIAAIAVVVPIVALLVIFALLYFPYKQRQMSRPLESMSSKN